MNRAYGCSIDSLYLEVRPLPLRWTVETGEDVFLDLDEDGKSIEYDTQHAFKMTELVQWLMREYQHQARSAFVE
jgi:uncharacterized protein YuzE